MKLKYEIIEVESADHNGRKSTGYTIGFKGEEGVGQATASVFDTPEEAREFFEKNFKGLKLES